MTLLLNAINYVVYTIHTNQEAIPIQNMNCQSSWQADESVPSVMWFMKPSNGSSRAGIIRFEGCKCDDKSWILKRVEIESWTSSVPNFADCVRVTVSSAGGWLFIAPPPSALVNICLCMRGNFTYLCTLSFYNWSHLLESLE
jgi:hypothetical protein